MAFKVNSENGTLFLKQIKERDHMYMGEGVIAHVHTCMWKPGDSTRRHPQECSYLL